MYAYIEVKATIVTWIWEDPCPYRCICLPTHSLPARSTSCNLVLTCFIFSAASSCAGEEALEEEVDLLSLIFCGKVQETSLCSL